MPFSNIKNTSFILLILLLFTACSTGGTYESQNAVGTTQTQVEGERATQTEKASDKATHHFPDPVGYVNDFDRILSVKQNQTLTQIIRQHEKVTSNQIAIATIPDFATYSNIDDLTFDLFKFWGVGQKGKDNGVLVVFCQKEKKVRISTGYGLETILTDEEAQTIINKKMNPKFAEGNFFEGLKIGLEAIVQQLEKGA